MRTQTNAKPRDLVKFSLRRTLETSVAKFGGPSVAILMQRDDVNAGPSRAQRLHQDPWTGPDE